MSTVSQCQSCGMTMEYADDHGGGDEAVPYCRFCTTPEGDLQPFEERFEKMVSWAMRHDGLDRPTAETRTREHMQTMPAWEGHPKLRG